MNPDLQVYCPCTRDAVLYKLVGDAVDHLFRATCAHGAFAACNTPEAAIQQALAQCRSDRATGLLADVTAGRRFTYEETRQLAAWKLAPNPTRPTRVPPQALTQEALEDLVYYLTTPASDALPHGRRQDLEAAITELLGHRARRAAEEREETRILEARLNAPEKAEFEVRLPPQPRWAMTKGKYGTVADAKRERDPLYSAAPHTCNDPAARFKFCDACRVELEREMAGKKSWRDTSGMLHDGDPAKEAYACVVCADPQNHQVDVGNYKHPRCNNHPPGYQHCTLTASHADQCNLVPLPVKLLEPLWDSQVEWVVNSLGELGVKIGDQLFFLYKGRSLIYSGGTKKHPVLWRPVYKREFGETMKAPKINTNEIALDAKNYPGGQLYHGIDYIAGQGWKPLPQQPRKDTDEGAESDD